MISCHRYLNGPGETCFGRITGRRQFVRRYLGSCRKNENLNRTPICIEVRPRLLAHAQRLELTVVKAKVFDEVLAHNHGPSLGEYQIFLGITLHAGRYYDYSKAELI